jgi:hypothetical protein
VITDKYQEGIALCREDFKSIGSRLIESLERMDTLCESLAELLRIRPEDLAEDDLPAHVRAIARIVREFLDEIQKCPILIRNRGISGNAPIVEPLVNPFEERFLSLGIQINADQLARPYIEYANQLRAERIAEQQRQERIAAARREIEFRRSLEERLLAGEDIDLEREKARLEGKAVLPVSTYSELLRLPLEALENIAKEAGLLDQLPENRNERCQFLWKASGRELPFREDAIPA